MHTVDVQLRRGFNPSAQIGCVFFVGCPVHLIHLAREHRGKCKANGVFGLRRRLHKLLLSVTSKTKTHGAAGMTLVGNGKRRYYFSRTRSPV
jgi:hypothetical protein